METNVQRCFEILKDVFKDIMFYEKNVEDCYKYLDNLKLFTSEEIMESIKLFINQ